MARPSARSTDMAAAPGQDVVASRHRHPSAAAPSQAFQAPEVQAASQRALQPPSAAHRRARNASVVSNNLDSSDLVNLDPSQLHVESDSDDSDFRASRGPPHGSGHARSMSNPFPSFFSPRKKKTAPGHLGPGFGDSELSDDGEPAITSGPRDGKPTAEHHLAPTSPNYGRRSSFSTGPCITCGSLMRWARGVEAFRCSICLTVNDLVPKRKAVAKVADVHSTTSSSSAPRPISLQQTKALIMQCLQSHISAILSDVDTSSREVPRPAHSTQPPKAPRAPARDVSAAEGDIRAGSSRTSELSLHTPVWQQLGSSSRRSSKSRLVQHKWIEPAVQPLNSQSLLKHQRHPHVSSLGPAVPTLPSAKPAAARENPSRPSKPVAQSTTQSPPEKEAKRIFRPLEDYIVSRIFSMDCLDSSFVPIRASGASRPLGSISSRHVTGSHKQPLSYVGNFAISEADQEQPAAGDPSENSSWWTNVQGLIRSPRSSHHRQISEGGNARNASPARPIHVDWSAVDEWYSTVLNAGETWADVYNELVATGACQPFPNLMLEQIEDQILAGQEHAQRVLLKAIETVLKRPGRRISESGDFRFLLIALANPLLHASCRPFSGIFQRDGHAPRSRPQPKPEASRGTGPASGQHSVIIKRILGLISNSSDEWHNQMIACFAQFSEARFLQTKDLVSGFLAYRLVRYNEKKDKDETTKAEIADSLVPKVSEGASAASFHAALSQASGQAKTPKQPTQKKMTHGDDWQIKAAVRVLGLLFAANNAGHGSRRPSEQSSAPMSSSGTGSRGRLREQILPTSDFYITLLDNCDLVADFEAWEQQKSKFAFCQYPFLLSIWAKIQILEHEARRQMKNKARDAFFDSIMTRRNFDQHLILNVRRDCLVEDSLKGVSEAIGSGTDDIKKGLRIIFNGEEGIDAGGLRKEWFLLLVREVFNPDHGMFTYDDESQYCYFNPASFETSDQFFLVGVVLGLAIYNSTILDIALPPFAFRKLLLAAPAPSTGLSTVSSRSSMTYTLADLAEYQPRLARGLQQLLEYNGDVESTFCLDFTVAVERYGSIDTIPLCPGGGTRAVNNSNRQEYVNLYVRYVLDTAVSRQFEPFKRGFFTVCGCNALGLFRPEEIELLVRGSDEVLDIASLRLAASYENWSSREPFESEPTVRWFWEAFEEASPRDQRKLLLFITGSDRIPATGPASLSIRILCLGNDVGRFPTARTCFNTLTLYRYDSKEKLQRRLWGAVDESEGFGLK